MAQVFSQPSYGINPRVVIVDDHPTFRHAARILLAARGYHVVGEASCAASALDAVECHAPQAVLLDVRLGDDDGFEVCVALTRSRPELAVLLASVDEQDPERIKRCGARGFVRKSRLLQIDFGEFWPRANLGAVMGTSWSSEIHPDAEPAGDIPLPFRVEVEPERDGMRVCPIGELDMATVDEVRAQFVEMRSVGFSRLILDLRRTTFLDSTGLRLAIDENSASARNGHSFAIFPGPPTVQHVFEISGLAARLPFVDPNAADLSPS